MKNLDNRVKCIKVYVNGKSVEIQKKLFELGVKWVSDKTEVMNLAEPFLYINEKGFLTSGSSMITFIKNKSKEVSYLDVLSWEVKPQSQPIRPFQKVLVRDYDREKWSASFYSHAVETREGFEFMCAGLLWEQCIPYEGNEHLLGTNDSPYKEAGN